MASKAATNPARPIRPLPTRVQNLSFSTTNTVSTDIINYTLNNIEPAALHSQLSLGLKNLHQNQIDQLLSLLQAGKLVTDREVAAATDSTQRHCARCHKSYIERNNGSSACQILHCKPDLSSTTATPSNDATNVHIITADPVLFGAGTRSGEAGTATTRTVAMKVELVYPCCGLRVKPGVNVHPCCFRGRHTTRSENVRYNPRTTLPCDRMGCAGRVPPAPMLAATTVGGENTAGTNVDRD
ncbi:hypothetical protein DXG01_005299 [Tephrocybe rancida]|nr:hypothetical protein DXG01_005299 [Tephrocybe rancida]